MNTEKLRYAVCVAQLGSFTKAAEQLYITQPALTKSINGLERELGIKLFTRSKNPKHPVALTPAGQYLLEQGTELLERQESFEKAIMEFSNGYSGKLTLGLGTGRANFWLPLILPAFWRRYPNVEVRCVTGGAHYLEQQLISQKLDMCYLNLPDFSAQTLSYSLIKRERLLLALPRDHPLIQARAGQECSRLRPLLLRPEELAGQHFVAAPKNHGITIALHQMFSRHGIIPGKITEVNNCDMSYAMAAAGIGIALVFANCMDYPGNPLVPAFATVDDPPLSMATMAAVRKNQGMSPAMKNFLDTTIEVVSKLPDD